MLDEMKPKSTVTPQQRANALEALYVMWPSVPKENVVRSLRVFRVPNGAPSSPPTCHTIACFGGWCAWWPSFRRQGVFASARDGSPRMKKVDWSSDVAHRLFGKPAESIFGARSFDEDFYVTDHEIITRRLQKLIACTTVRKRITRNNRG